MNYIEIAAKYKVPVAHVEAEYTRVREELITQGLSPKDIDVNTEELVQHRLRTATSRSKGELYLGQVLAVDRLKDNANPPGKPTPRSLQMTAYIANPDEAIATGKVALLEVGQDEDHLLRTMKDKKTGNVKKEIVTSKIWEEQRIKVGDKFIVPLDNLAKWPNQKDNISYLRALPLHQYRTTVVVGIKTNKGFKLAELDYNSEQLPGKIPMYVDVEFVAIPKDEVNGILNLRTNKFTQFYPSTTKLGITPIELLEGFLKGIKYPLSKLNEYHTKMVKEGKKWDTLVMVEAFVSDIRGLDKTPQIFINDNSRPVGEPPTKVWLHDGITINFGKDSKVYVIGRTSQSDKWDSETRSVMNGVLGDVEIWAMGIYPKFSTKPKNIQPITEGTI